MTEECGFIQNLINGMQKKLRLRPMVLNNRRTMVRILKKINKQ